MNLAATQLALILPGSSGVIRPDHPGLIDLDLARGRTTPVVYPAAVVYNSTDPITYTVHSASNKRSQRKIFVRDQTVTEEWMIVHDHEQQQQQQQTS